MREKILQLIESEHPFDKAVEDIVDGLKRDFFALEEGAIPEDDQKRAIAEIREQLVARKTEREQALISIYESFDEQEIDALLLLSRTSTAQKLRQAMIAANELKWKWVNAAKDDSPAMRAIIYIAQTKWNENNVGEHATIAAPGEEIKPLEDLTAATSEPPSAA